MKSDNSWDNLFDAAVKPSISANGVKITGLIINVIKIELKGIQRNVETLIRAPYEQAQTALDQAKVSPSEKRRNVLYDEARRLFVQAASQLKDLDPPMAAKAFILAGVCYEMAKLYSEALVLYEKGLSVAVAYRDKLISSNNRARAGRITAETAKTSSGLGLIVAAGIISGTIFPPLGLPLFLIGNELLSFTDWGHVSEGRILPEVRVFITKLEEMCSACKGRATSESKGKKCALD